MTLNTLTLEQGALLSLLEEVRTLPGRRLVFRAMWQQQAVFAKVFFGQTALRYANRDAQGAQRLSAAGIQTPALLWQGAAIYDSQPVQVLIYAAVDAAVSAAEAYQQALAADKRMLLERLVDILAAQHAAGLCQTDLHLNNFLLAHGVVWAIDGDGIRTRMLTERQALRQLAELISKLNVFDQYALTASLLVRYLQARAWSSSVGDAQLLQWALHMKTREVERYVRDKIFRNCSDIHWLQSARQVQAVSVTGGLQPVTVEVLEAAMREGRALKLGNTCTVIQASLQGRTVVIKRYNIKHTLHALSRAWRASRAAASWSNAHRLQYYGIATPAPMLMLEQRWFGLRGKAYFVAAYSPLPDVLQFFKQTQDKRLRAEAVKQLVTFCYQMYLLRLSHGDLKASNLQVSENGQLVVMDLDSMRQHRLANTALRAHVKDLRRLLQNWKDDTSLYNALVKNFQVVYQDHTPLQRAGISI